jgi:hypothetical protein
MRTLVQFAKVSFTVQESKLWLGSALALLNSGVVGQRELKPLSFKDATHELEELLLEDNPLKAKKRNPNLDINTLSAEMRLMEEVRRLLVCLSPYDPRRCMLNVCADPDAELSHLRLHKDAAQVVVRL